jgi:hypothetical protein
VKVADRKSDAVAYLYPTPKGPGAVLFYGKRDRATWRFYFRTEAARESRIREGFETRRGWLELIAKRAAERKAEGRGLEVGDVLKASWGYDQTNVDWYEVVRLIGKTKVGIRPIAAESVETSSMVGKCVPCPGQYKGPELVKVAKGGGVKIASYAWARKVEPTRIAGCTVYPAANWTAYA